MPPEDGISRETPTGRAVGKNMVWHNFFYCSEICYAFAYICKFRYIEKMGDSPQPQQPQNISHYMFLFKYYESFSSPLYTLVRAVITWAFWNRQDKHYEIVMSYCVSFFSITFTISLNSSSSPSYDSPINTLSFKNFIAFDIARLINCF